MNLLKILMVSLVCLNTPAVFCGGAIDLTRMEQVVGYTVTGQVPDSALHQILDGIGDFNGDGYDDFIVGSAAEGETLYQGAAYVIYGGPSQLPVVNVQTFITDNTRGFRIYGDNIDVFAVDVVGVGDVNADGYSDILIGTWDRSAYLIFGGPGPHQNLDVHTLTYDNSRGIHLYDSQSDSKFGFNIGAAGDINADGFDDFVIGPWHLVLFGRPTNQMANFDVRNFISSDVNGFVVAGDRDDLITPVGDFNGDNIDDVLIGRRLVFGKRQGFGDIIMEEPGDQYSVVPLNEDRAITLHSGDFNGDGLADICWGVRNEGYILYGRQNVAPYLLTPDVTFELGPYTFLDLAGFVGDTNSDGYSDLLFQTYTNGHDQSTSTIHLVYGNPRMPHQVDLSKLSSAQKLKIYPPDDFFWSAYEMLYVSDLGDMNSDGYDDYGFAFWTESGDKLFVLSGWQLPTSAATSWQWFY